MANGGGIYIVGYCIGAKYALLLASDPSDSHSEGTEIDVEKKKAAIKAVAIAHGKWLITAWFSFLIFPGTMISVSDFENLKAPITIVSVGM